MKIALNIFANCSEESPNIEIIRQTYDSFVKIFGEIPLYIYVDREPYKDRYSQYLKNIKQEFSTSAPLKKIIMTQGLAHGYVLSIKQSRADYLFQLEYDWQLHDIKHSLDEIIQLMKERGAYHFRFNKRLDKPNFKSDKWHSYMIEKTHNGMKFLVTDNLSNNPHIIDRKFYLNKLINNIDTTKGKSFGIEENLTRKGYKSYVYGGWECVTAKHLTPLTRK